MSTFQDRVDARRKTFKKGVDADDARRRREDENVQLRKAKRDEQLTKKRLMRDDAENAENEPVNANFSLDPGMNAAAAKLKDPATDSQTILAVVTEIRKQLSRAKQPPIQEAINAGIVPLAVKFLGSDNAKLQFEASWVLTNIASGESHQTQSVVDSGGIPPMLELLRTGEIETKEQVVWALANIAGDSAKLRDQCLQAGTLDAFLACLVQHEDRIDMLKQSTWGISNLCRGKPHPPIEYVSKALPYLCQLLVACTEPEVLTDALWALSYIADGDEHRINLLLESGVVGTVVQALGCGKDDFGTPAIRVVGNIATGNNQQTQVIVSCGALGHLPSFLHSKKSSLVKEACWLLSNITAGTSDQIQAVIDAGLLSKVMELCTGGHTHLVRKEAFWTISNLAVGGRPDQIQAAVGLGLIEALVEGLSFQGDAQLICAVIDGLSNVLKVGAETSDGENRYFALMEESEGSEKLEALQEDQNEEVYNKAVRLLQTYCEVEDQDADACAYESEAPAQFNFAC